MADYLLPQSLDKYPELIERALILRNEWGINIQWTGQHHTKTLAAWIRKPYLALGLGAWIADDHVGVGFSLHRNTDKYPDQYGKTILDQLGNRRALRMLNESLKQLNGGKLQGRIHMRDSANYESIKFLLPKSRGNKEKALALLILAIKDTSNKLGLHDVVELIG
jgi:hypothetical protein